MSEPTKICSNCCRVKILECFHRDKTAKDGRAYHCKECAIARSRNHYQANKPPPKARKSAIPLHLHPSRAPERQREYKRRWAEEHRESINAKHHAFRATEEGRKYQREYMRQCRASLSAGYVAQLLRQRATNGIIPVGLVDAKREHLRLVRLIKDMKK